MNQGLFLALGMLEYDYRCGLQELDEEIESVEKKIKTLKSKSRRLTRDIEMNLIDPRNIVLDRAGCDALRSELQARRDNLGVQKAKMTSQYETRREQLIDMLKKN